MYIQRERERRGEFAAFVVVLSLTSCSSVVTKSLELTRYMIHADPVVGGDPCIVRHCRRYRKVTCLWRC